MSKIDEKSKLFFDKVQPVVSGIMIFDFDFMKFDLDFSGIYVFDIPIGLDIDIAIYESGSQRPRPSGRGLKKGNNSLAASIPTLPGGALKGGGKHLRC